MATLVERAELLAEEYRGVSKVALSYSGGLDSAVVGTLLQKAGFAVLPVAVDVGQHSDFARIAKNAKAMFGACVTIDARQEVADAAFRALKASFGSDGRLNPGGMNRPALARALAGAARRNGCTAIAHGSSGVGNDHLNMENSLRVLAPEVRIMAPVRDLDLKRDESLEFAKEEKLATNLGRAGKFSADESLWGRVIRQGATLDAGEPLPEEAYQWTVSPQKAPAKPQTVVLEFLNGIPVTARIGGKKVTGAVQMMAALNETGGRHGVGRSEAMDDKVVGLKVREGYECPAARMLLFAHRALEEMTLTPKELSFKSYVDARWSRLVHEGGWHTRLRHALDAFIDETQRAVDGSVSLELYRGNVSLKGRSSPHALYDRRLSGRDSKGVFSQKESRHFAKLYGLQDIIAYMIDVD